MFGRKAEKTLFVLRDVHCRLLLKHFTQSGDFLGRESGFYLDLESVLLWITYVNLIYPINLFVCSNEDCQYFFRIISRFYECKKYLNL